MEIPNPLVLIVEDQIALAQLYKKAFEEACYETAVMHDGEKAAAWLEQGTPAIIVLDLHLPFVSGRELLQKIRANTRLHKTQVLLVSAYVQAVDYQTLDADFVMTKPVSYFQVHQLAARLRSGA